jgi:winged helix domain-containing protein/ATPase family protein associated with various cellular activities (AAA)
MTATLAAMTGEEWKTANSSYLVAEMERVRLLLRRRILWLRQHWRRDTTSSHLSWAISDHEAEGLLSAEDLQEEFAFYQSDPDAREVGALLEKSRLQISAQRQELQDSGAAAAVDVLSARFGLNSFERDVVLLCLAPELDPSFERLYAYVQDDATRKFSTPYLALTLLSTGRDFALLNHGALLPSGPLRRWGLITTESASSGAKSGSALRIDERMVDYLLGFNRLDERCHRLVRPPSGALVPICHGEFISRLAEWLGAGSNRLTLLNLVGHADCGRSAIAEVACHEAALNLLVLNSQALYSAGAERTELIGILEREANLLGLVFYLDQDELKREEAHTLLTELARCAVPLIIASRERVSCEREILAVQVTRPGASEQSELWRRALGNSAASFNGGIDSLVEQFDFGPRGIARTVALAENQSKLRTSGDDALSLADIWQACCQQTAGQLEQLAQKVEPCYDWDDIVVPSEVLRQLKEITGQVAHRHLVYQGWGFGKKLNRGRGISALFSGASGVGKTMAAEVMAHDLKLDLYRIDLAGVVSKYIGETEKNLRSVFDAAERSGAILFFDEADALFGKRSEVKDSHDRYANIEVNYLLQRMEEYRGLAILATNMKAALDSAFTRRLRFIVEFPFPDASQRKEIWRKVFPVAAALDGLDFGNLSRLEITGGNIRNIAVNAAFLAAGEDRSIGMGHVMRAARREYTKIDRLIMDAEFGRYASAGAEP